jgi:hypothetical protein
VNSHRPSSTRGKVGLQAGVSHALHDRGSKHMTFVAIADVAARLDVCERTGAGSRQSLFRYTPLAVLCAFSRLMTVARFSIVKHRAKRRPGN